MEPPIMTINDYRGNNFEIDSQCFADDTVVCTNLKNDSQIKYFLWALDNLALGTGLEINPVKTKILIFGEHLTEIKTQIRQIGKTNLGYCHDNGYCLLNRITGLSEKIQGFQYGSRAID